MLRNRVLPVLLVKDNGLVKTVRFREPKYVGDPINAIRIFNEKEVDELVLLDITASANGRGPNFELVNDVASECFMPLAYGGGVRDVDDAKKLFSMGVEKVILRASAARDPQVIARIAEFAGASSVAVSIDVRRSRLRRLHLHLPGSGLDGDPDWLGHMQRVIDAGAGEIVLQSVDRDGTMSGMDLALIKQAADTCSVPLVAVGGVSSLGDIGAGIVAGADAVGAGAFFVYHGSRRAVLITYPSYSELTKTLGAT